MKSAVEVTGDGKQAAIDQYINNIPELILNPPDVGNGRVTWFVKK